MAIPVRNSVKVLLFNEHDELLLMCADDPKTTSADTSYHGRFGYCIGGEMNQGESPQEAALRETYEETGIPHDKIQIGPIVWFGEFDMILHGILTHLKQTFIVAKTKHNEVFLNDLDQWEKKFVKNIAWFSLEKIKNSEEPIFPSVLPNYLPDIVSDQYPIEPFEIDLAKQPEKKRFV